MKYTAFAFAILFVLIASVPEASAVVCARGVSGWLCRSTRRRSRASPGCGLRVGARRPRL
jgi:hypothetical protein